MLVQSIFRRGVFIILGTIVNLMAFSQTYTGTFRTPTGLATYHQFNRTGGGAAVYINQVDLKQPILRLSSGTATANKNVVFTVQNDGSVGIGTITPQAKLSVEGNILAKEIKIKTDISVPDYVFEPDYNLMTLSEIERFVSLHRHLPDVPSASKIETNGLDVAEINLVLLKKIEELTLHLIEKEKQLDALEKRLQKIESKNRFIFF